MIKKRHHILLFFLLLACSNLVLAQDDSDINPALTTDTTEVLELLAKAKNTQWRKEKIQLSELALDLSRKLNYANGTTSALTLLNETYQRGDDALKALAYAIEELHEVKNHGDMARYYQMSSLIARIYLDYGNAPKALDYFKNAERQLYFATNEREKAQLFEYMGDAFLATNKDIEANQYYNKAIDLLNNYREEQRILQKISNALIAARKYEQAILSLQFIKEKATQKGQKTDIAIAANNIATIHHSQGNFAKAIPFFEEALKEEKRLSSNTLSVLYANLGVAYQNTGNNRQAINALNKAIVYCKSNKNKKEEILILDLLSNIYFNQKDIFNAQKYNRDAENLLSNERIDIAIKAEVYKTSAKVFQQLFEYEKAFEYYKKYLELKDNILLSERAAQQDLQRQVFLLEKQEKELQLSLINKDIQTLSLNQLRLEKEKLALEAARKENELALLKQTEQANSALLKNKELEALQTRQALELANQNLLAAEKDKSLQTLKQKELVQASLLAQQKAETQQSLQAISLLQKDKDLLTVNNELLSKDAALKQLEIDSQANFRRAAYGIGLLLLAITALIIRGLYLTRRNNRLLSQKNKEIEASRQETDTERQKAEKLLHNILPEETAEELKTFGAAIPRRYEKVSVMFTDFSNFTKTSAKMSPEELISELNICFSAFDEIIEKHGLEKIKTIGDAYMCAGGIPIANDDNPIQTVAAALDLQAFMRNHNAEKVKHSEPYFLMRVGIHTGEVVTGVVGKNKFAYDIWGDTVNLASRMESTCPPEGINISEATYRHVRSKYQCTPRGEIEAKGKGKVTMYLVS